MKVLVVHNFHRSGSASGDDQIFKHETAKDLICSCPEYQKLWKAAQDSAEWKVHTAKEGA